MLAYNRDIILYKLKYVLILKYRGNIGASIHNEHIYSLFEHITFENVET